MGAVNTIPNGYGGLAESDPIPSLATQAFPDPDLIGKYEETGDDIYWAAFVDRIREIAGEEFRRGPERDGFCGAPT